MGTKMVAIKKILFLSMVGLILSAQSSYAHSSIVKIGDWNIMRETKNNKHSCVAYSTAFRTKGSTLDREKPYAVVENKGKKQYSVGISPGYTIDVQKGVTVKINNKSRLLDVKLAKTAWTFSEVQDSKLLNDMLKNQKFMTVRSYDQQDNVTLDYYSLRGLVNVINYFDARCN